MGARVAVCVLALLAAACCGRSGVFSASVNDSDLGKSDYVFVISQTSFSSNLATVPPSGRVVFLNRDIVAHQIVSDGPRGKPDCPELNGVPIPPQGHLTFVMANHAEVCGFHDLFPEPAPSNAPDTTFGRPQVQGTIIVAGAGSTSVVTPGSPATNAGTSGGAGGTGGTAATGP